MTLMSPVASTEQVVVMRIMVLNPGYGATPADWIRLCIIWWKYGQGGGALGGGALGGGGGAGNAVIQPHVHLRAGKHYGPLMKYSIYLYNKNTHTHQVFCLVPSE